MRAVEDGGDYLLPLTIPLTKVEEIIRLSRLIDDTHRNLISIWKGEKKFAFFEFLSCNPCSTLRPITASTTR